MAPDQLERRAQSRLGTVLRDKYRLDSVVGVGGMAVVYKATHRNQAKLAIKMLHPELSLNGDVRARFLREGYAANTVNHPGAVLVVDDDVSEDGAAFLVMELLDGVPCDALWLRSRGQLPIDAVCAIAVELLDVLAAAHANGIIHRDIKPANLFVTRDGRLKVLDFGIARVRDTTGGALTTGTGAVLGTPAFMSPEQVVGKASDLDARADLWGVGATMFTLVSGELVHAAETGPQFFVKVATQPVRSLGEVVPGAPAAIVRVVDRALALDRARRWPTAAAMQSELASAARSTFGEIPARERIASLVASSGAPSAGGAIAATESSPRVATMTLQAVAPAPPPVAGVETTKPVSSDGAVAVTRPRPAVALVFAALGVLASIAALIFALRHGQTLLLKSRAAAAGTTGAGAVPSVTSASPRPVDQEGAASAPARPVAPQSAESGEGAAIVIAPETPDASLTSTARPEVAHTESAPSSHRASGEAHRVAAPPPPPASPPPPAPSAGAGCNPNYYLDPNGEKHFKRECFQ